MRQMSQLDKKIGSKHYSLSKLFFIFMNVDKKIQILYAKNNRRRNIQFLAYDSCLIESGLFFARKIFTNARGVDAN